MPNKQYWLKRICLIASAGLLLWLEYGEMISVGAAMALDHPEDPMTLKLEHAGESPSHMLPLQPDCPFIVLI